MAENFMELMEDTFNFKELSEFPSRIKKNFTLRLMSAKPLDTIDRI